MQYHAIACNSIHYNAIPCNIMQYYVVPCNTVQYHAIPCNSMQYHAIPCNTMQYHVVPCNTVQYHAIPCNTMKYHVIPCITMQYHAIPCMPNNCWRSVPLPCGQYMAIFSSIRSSNSNSNLLVIHPHFFRAHPSSTLDFHFLSHYSYIKSNHWTHLQDSAR